MATETATRDRRRLAKLAIKTTIGLIVLAAVGRHVYKTWQSLHERGASIRVEPGWVAACVALYLAGLACDAAYYAIVVDRGSARVPWFAAVRAYLISHLGKYVPGKAMVVVMRVGLTSPYGARPATAAFATLYETITMMAAGGLVAAVGFLAPPARPLWAALGLGLGVGFLVLVEPRVFPRISRLISVPFPGVGPDAVPRLSHGLLALGLLWATAGWILLGLSQAAAVRALTSAGPAPTLWPSIIAAVALATVAGFAVAVMPGGLGVREGVLMAALAPTFGDTTAVAAALLLRLGWVGAEALAAVVLFPLGRSARTISMPPSGEPRSDS